MYYSTMRQSQTLPPTPPATYNITKPHYQVIYCFCYYT